MKSTRVVVWWDTFSKSASRFDTNLAAMNGALLEGRGPRFRKRFSNRRSARAARGGSVSRPAKACRRPGAAPA